MTYARFGRQTASRGLPVTRRLTQPFTAVELHSHAHRHGVIRHGHEADETSDDRGLQVLEHHVVRVLVAFNDLAQAAVIYMQHQVWKREKGPLLHFAFYLPSFPVIPAHPAAAVPAVLYPVPLGKLITHAVGMATLRAHQRDEVQRAQVHLEVFLEGVWL